jgi:hypothetical protein
MEVLIANIQWIMVVAGMLTLSLLLALVSPKSALTSTFGETLDGPLADIIVRNWGGLIAIMGGMLLYGAIHAPSRPLVLVAAGLSKLIFISLVLVHRDRYFKGGARSAVVVDLVLVVLFAAYLVGTRGAA